MSFLKKLPWLSLLIMLVTDITFGWLLSAWYLGWENWLLAAALLVIIAWALTNPLKNLTKGLTGLLKSDIKAFIAVMIAAFSASVILRWIDFFVRVLVLLSAATLVRLDLQTAGYKQTQAFLILCVVSLIGLSMGIILQHLSRGW